VRLVSNPYKTKSLSIIAPAVTVPTGVVQGDADMIDTVPSCKPVQGSNIRRTIVENNFLDGTPSA
jgi:hypothetical protein